VVPEGGYDLVAMDQSTQLRVFNVLQGRGVGVLFAGLALRSARRGADVFAQAIKAAVESS
jgi:hypothetical protein